MTEEELVELLERGKIVAFPTDTVYGLIALPNKENVEKIYALKKRDRSKPLGLFLPHKKLLQNVVLIDYKRIDQLALFWPGALTLVLPVKETFFPHIQKSGKIGFRIPDSPLLLSILSKTGPLLQTSANVSGMPTPITSQEVRRIFGDRVYIVEGKAGNLSSTVLEYRDGTWVVLRKGSIPVVKIKKETGEKVVVTDGLNLLFLCTGNIERSPMAEAIARKLFRGLHVNIRSVGTFIGGKPYSSIGQRAVESLGYERIEGVSKTVSENDLLWADLVLVMEKKHYEFIEENFPQFVDRTFMLADDDVPDPIGLGLKTHELVARIIEQAIKTRWLEFIKSFFNQQKRGKA